MIVYLILNAISSAFILGLGFLTDVATLGNAHLLSIPDTVLTPMRIFKQTINTILIYLPWLQVVWNVIIYAVSVKILIWVIELVLFRRKLQGK